jgi:phage tail sheath protein FI
MVVRSREFKLTIEWVKTGAANPSVPGAERLVASETHRGLTLDDRHSRYIGRVIGRVDGPHRIWDRRPEGESNLVRVDDPSFPDTSQTTLRVGPDLVYEVLPGGRRRSAGRPLAGGGDDIGGVNAALYVGQDNVEPSLRTGTFALKNEDDISIVAVPGRADVDVANALILQCELDRYRFAVLDSEAGPEPEGATIADVTAQRQQYDTKYAALYWPWLRITHPFPPNPAMPGELSIPPSGHVLGVYARTDVTRGVHKAPANELVSGIVSFQRTVTKGEHDLLNPFPVNINVLRDFRTNFRGLRSWGARVISSDPAWRYVSVRRLFNYVEKSMDIGLQWVVFEPNDPNLWAQVERTISDFLTLVWRSGALFGSTAEEAFYVKCDSTTMSVQDIEAGRFIAEVGICPVRPAEFVVIRVSQWQGGSAVEEG